jgi:L-amino acid N-acyltransferase YncA
MTSGRSAKSTPILTVENSVYLEPVIRRCGIGLQLLQRRLAESESRGFRQMIAVIGDSANAARGTRGKGYDSFGPFGPWLVTTRCPIRRARSLA